MTVDALLKKTQLGVDIALRNDTFLLNQVKVQGEVNDFSYADTANMMAESDQVEYTVYYPNSLRRPYANVSFAANRFTAGMDDTVRVTIQQPTGKVKADFDNYGTRIKVNTNTQVAGLKVAMGSAITGKTGAAKVRFDAMYDDRKEDILEMLSPDLDVDVKESAFQIEGIEYPVELPRIDFSFSNNLFDVRNAELEIGNSRLALQGTLRNLADYLADKAMLEGRFDLGGPLIDADQLMGLVSGVGADSTQVEEPAVADSTATENTAVADADPFMVPLGVDFVLNTHVDKILASGASFNDVQGVVTCRDGVLVLDSVGFNSNAARMHLTALYKSPRRNNLFVGWNFHLLDIDIAEMINLVPEIDTIAPMVKAFAGKAEFHLAGQTNLFADYSPKMSTLKVVAAIEGHDLTVLDNETFQTVKKYLFKDCTTNKIDSISVEASIARKKLNLFPMLVSWDRYAAVISGVHSVVGSMPFNYHISITKCPVVGGHLGLNVSGNLDDLDNISYETGSCKYANLYRPEKQNVTQAHILELKSLIQSSLKETVK